MQLDSQRINIEHSQPVDLTTLFNGEGKATAYVCSNYKCQHPTTDVNTMLGLLSSDHSANINP